MEDGSFSKIKKKKIQPANLVICILFFYAQHQAMIKLIVCLLLLCVGSVFGAGLVDNPIVGDSITYLDGYP
jgi:hypothetical protein